MAKINSIFAKGCVNELYQFKKFNMNWTKVLYEQNETLFIYKIEKQFCFYLYKTINLSYEYAMYAFF